MFLLIYLSKDLIFSIKRIKSLEIEIDVLSELRHKNIVRYIGTSRNSDNFNIFLEYVTGKYAFKSFNSNIIY